MCGLYPFTESGQRISVCGLKNEPHVMLLLQLKARPSAQTLVD